MIGRTIAIPATSTTPATTTTAIVQGQQRQPRGILRLFATTTGGTTTTTTKKFVSGTALLALAWLFVVDDRVLFNNSNPSKTDLLLRRQQLPPRDGDPCATGASTSTSSSRNSSIFVQAMSISSSSNAASDGCSEPRTRRGRRQHRILCYGDSLTAGTSLYQLNPYAPHLEAGLKAKGRADVAVRHRGMPGWTTSNMLDDLDGPSTGLRSAIRAVKDPPLSLVVLLAGTNDIGYGSGADDITDNILKLHQVAFDNGVPRTIAIGIPPSGYQSVDEGARKLVDRINANLEAKAEETANDDSKHKMSFVPFPFQYVRGGDNWDTDSLHFSPKGYQVLGESLVPYVDRVLDELEQTYRDR